MSVIIEESGMRFGPFAEDLVFHIEQAPVYRSVRQHVKIAEFVLLEPRRNRPDCLFIVEAKSSSPRPGTDRLRDYLGEMQEKFCNALALYLALRCGRFGAQQAALPASLQTTSLEVVDIRFVLVIKGHDKAFLPPLKAALDKAMRTTWRTWNLNPQCVVVLNDAMARAKGFIAAPAQHQTAQ